MVLLLQMPVQLPQMGAVQMADRAALFTLQQKAAALVMGGAVLIVSSLICDHLVDKALSGQTLQLPVHRGKPHLLALGMQLLRQLRSRGAPLRTAGNILQHRPLRRVISLRIPLAYLLSVAALTVLFPQGGNNRLTWMLCQLLSGGLMLGAIFMATDYVTSPITHGGQIVYGIGCGVLTVAFRYFGSYPEGVTFAILIMNCCVGFFDKIGVPKRFGAVREKKKKGGEAA